MAFLFKSKKSQDRALASRDGGSQGSIQSGSARAVRDEKAAMQRATPTGSLNSIDNDGSGSPDQGYGRRGPSVDQGPQQPQSDLAVSFAFLTIFDFPRFVPVRSMGIE
jgi:hypothetical protein